MKKKLVAIMVQYRLTDQFAKDLKVSLKKIPEVTCDPLDDWVCDSFRIERKKIALVTHVSTLISFVFPYVEVGGVKNVLEFLPVELEDYLYSHGFDEYAGNMIKIFNKQSIFTTTNNHKVLDYMNDFKKNIENSIHCANSQINWHDISDTINDTIINIEGSSYRTPTQLLKVYLENYIECS